MSDHVLKLMRKGTTALRNIQLLKWCKGYNIAVDWNILYGFPGETREDYAAMMELLKRIRFLGPPTACGPVRLDRFSPYYNSAAEFGLVNVRPLAPYKYLYPFGEQSLARIVYYFDYDYAPALDPTGYAEEVIAYAEAWRREPEPGMLYSATRPDGALVLIDTRSDAVLRDLVLAGPARTAYECCDEVCSGAGVVRYLHKMFPDARFVEREVLTFLDSLVSHKLMVTDGKHYLSLAVSRHPVRTMSDHASPLPATSAAPGH
jgi:hypothetical protein